jgi:amino acid adenylation domain-containing protein
MRPAEEFDAVDAGQRPAPTDDVFILKASFAQQRLWLLDKLEAGNGYNVPLAVRASGPLRIEILERSLRELIARHEVLRTTFSEDESGNPVQVVAIEQPLVLAKHHVVRNNGTSVEDEARRLVIEHFRIPFNLKEGPLFRAMLLHLGDEDYVLAFAFHHTIVDGWSLGIFMRELSTIYEAFDQNRASPLPDLPIQYGDYAAWQHDSLRGKRLENLLAYWKQQLSGAPPILELPTDFPRPTVQTSSGAHESLTLPKAVEQGLMAASQKEGATLFMTLLASYSLLLARYSGQEDIVVGSPISGRTRSELENLIGFFVNTLPFRTDVSGNPSFRELLRRVRETALQAYEHQDLPFEKLVEELNPERNLSHTPIVQVMFTFENTASRRPLHMSSIVLTPFRGAEGLTTKFDLSLNSSLSPEGLTIGLTYNTDLFAPSTAKRMLTHLSTLLEAIAADPGARIADLQMLSKAERQTILVEWNQTVAEYPQETCLHHLFEQRAQRSPNAVAVVLGAEEITYRALNEKANRLANYLRKRGIDTESLIGIYLERSIDMVVALLAVLKAGGSYVPLDPAYPPERIGFILEDAGVAVLMSESTLLGALAPEHKNNAIALDAFATEIAKESQQAPVVNMKSENLAYVLYTSGSTGKPKGVQITHRNLVNFLCSMQREPGLTAKDVLVGVTTLSFDIAGLEIYLPLISGARLLLASRAEASDGRLLLGLLERKRPTIMQATPATWHMLIEAGWQGNAKLKALCGGEALPADLAEQLLPRCRELWNMYGPTETTIWSSVYRVQSAMPTTPIGKPIANTTFYVLDAQLQPVPIGVGGELYIGGHGVARGYYHRPELTAEKFVVDPFAADASARMYRTGDVARYLADGNVQYLGRTDFQVKIRGFRIELGEIETVLAKHPAVQQAIVAARVDSPGDKRLVAYVVPQGGQHLGVSEMRAQVKHSLPDYMVPSVFVELDALPLTPNGKVDRKALAKREIEAFTSGAVVEARDPLEKQLLEVWKAILRTPNVGITDNFFHLGGHSLMAARLLAEVEKTVGRNIPLAALFRGPTVESMAKLLREGTESNPDPIIMQIQAGRSVPFFAVVAPGREAIGYAALAQAMGPEQTFYKLQSHRPEPPDTPVMLSDMKGLARHYIQAMRSVQPKGPYFLGGMCAGTHIGEQMVLQLEAEGEQVALFAILDTWVRQNSQVRWKWQVYYYRKRLRGLLNLSIGQQVKVVREVMSRKLRRIAHPLTKPPQTSWGKLFWPGNDFTPPTFRAPIALFKRPRQPFYYVKDEAMGWATRTLSQLEIHRIASPHHMLREPYVRELAKRLLECMSRAQAAPLERQHV